MSFDAEQLTRELSIFSDVGAGALKLTKTEKTITIRFIRGGTNLTLRFNNSTGQIVETSDDSSLEIRHVSYKALLASEHFANLRGWAGAQQQVTKQAIDEQSMLDISGNLLIDDTQTNATLSAVEAYLSDISNRNNSVRVLLIDGPAGVGKTQLIERLVLRRSRDHMHSQAPLILHVKSRGRVLTYLQDLMAFSLQTIRASVTYDQLPILIRHGLIQLAIDGFDELGDPNGYDTAWSQLRDLVEDIEGQGTLILAGRETFIGRDRLEKAIPRLEDSRHSIGVLSLQATPPAAARTWLRGRGWSTEKVSAAEDWGVFEEGSYALRPFFLSKLAELGEENDKVLSQPPLILLVKSMIERESKKFGDHVEKFLDQDQRKKFVFDVLSEVARDIADSQSESIDEDALSWTVDMALGDMADQEVKRLLKNRISALAFLSPDERRGHRRFTHSEFFNYFLSHSAICAICSKEMPKFLRRTILGVDFLVSFATVLEACSEDRILEFFSAAQELLEHHSGFDRGARNIGALLLTGLSATSQQNIKIASIDVDEGVIRGKVEGATLSHITISQFDVRDADISSITFDKVEIAALVANKETRFPASFPDVGFIQIIGPECEGAPLYGEQASSWIDIHGRARKDAERALVPDDIRRHDTFQLLEKICRVMLRHHWIRNIGDDRAAQLVQNPNWDYLRVLLEKWKLLSSDDARPVGGRPSTFFHIRHAREILSEAQVPEVQGFLRELVSHIAELLISQKLEN